MAVPRNRSSNARKGSRRSHHMKKTINFKNCSSCGQLALPHRVCSGCGMYGQKQIVSVAGAE